jgi:Protein of unknown function (DUF1176)
VRRAAVAALLLLLSAAGASAGSLPGTNTKQERSQWRKLLHWPSSCETSWQQAGIGSVTAGISVWTAPAGSHLVEVSCYLGAYQGQSMVYLLRADRTRAGPLPFVIYTGLPKPVRETMVVGSLAYTPRTRLLSVFDKFRGVGDCGVYSVFRLTGERLVPYLVRAKPACDDQPPFDPLRWPRVPTPH